MMLWKTQTLLQWILIFATLLSQTMRRSGATQAKRRAHNCETTGTGMGGRRGSCHGRCFGYDRGRNCQCNYQCIECDNCCGDYKDCNEVASCATRCGAVYDRSQRCHCDNRCKIEGNCCFDYTEQCEPPTSSTAVTNLTTEANGESSTSSTAVTNLTPKANGEPPTSTTAQTNLTPKSNGESPTSTTAVPNLTPKANGESSTSTTAVTNLTPKAYGGTGPIVVVILVICLVITSAIAAAVFILIRKRRTNPTTTENGNGSGPTNVTSGTGQEEQGSIYYASVKENEYANQEEGFESNVAYQSYEEKIFQDNVTT